MSRERFVIGTSTFTRFSDPCDTKPVEFHIISYLSVSQHSCLRSRHDHSAICANYYCCEPTRLQTVRSGYGSWLVWYESFIVVIVRGVDAIKYYAVLCPIIYVRVCALLTENQGGVGRRRYSGNGPARDLSSQRAGAPEHRRAKGKPGNRMPSHPQVQKQIQALLRTNERRSWLWILHICPPYRKAVSRTDSLI